MGKVLTRASASAQSVRPIKVVQFGEGNFLRAFVDWIIDILNEKTSFNGDVVVVQPLRGGMAKMINEQDGLYHVLLNGLQHGKPVEHTKLITCVREVVNPYEDPDAYYDTATNPDLRFVFSNTTEAGIAFNSADTNPDVVSESFPGKLTSFLFRRYKAFHGAPEKGLIIIPCELIDKNGDKLKETILQYAEHWNLEDGFATWIKSACIFCNTLVDRIVPGFPKETIGEIQQRLGYNDNLVVTAEPFHLWVIEGPAQVKKELPTEQARLQVLFVDNQAPYRTRKVRILNGAHTALVPVAYLAGRRLVQEAVEDSFTGNFIREAIFDEIIPTLDLPADELKRFAEDVIERFRNPFVKHALSSIALNSISKYKVRVLPSLLEYQKRKGTLPDHLVFALGCLMRFYEGTWQGEDLPVQDSDDIVSFFKDVWSSGDSSSVVNKVLKNESLWDADLTAVPGLEAALINVLDELKTKDVEAAWLNFAGITR